MRKPQRQSRQANKIRHVKQEQEYGCIAACIAMVLGVEYRDIAINFRNDFDRSGVKGELAAQYICDHGFSAIEKRARGFMDIKQSNKRMLEPFAEIHIISGSQFIDSKNNHAFVMDNKGRTLNPGSDEPHDPIADYYSIDWVWGFWKEQKT